MDGVELIPKYWTTGCFISNDPEQNALGIITVKGWQKDNNQYAIGLIVDYCTVNKQWTALDSILAVLLGEGFEHLNLKERLTVYSFNVCQEVL